MEVKYEKLRLCDSFFSITKIFKEVFKQEQKNLLLQTDDLLVRFLNVIEFWKQKNSNVENVIFIL